MNERNKRKFIKKLAFKNYAKIISSSKHIINSWGIKRIPLKTLNIIMDKAKLNSKTKDEGILAFERKFNSILVVIKGLFRKQSKVVGDDAISISEITAIIDAAKDGFVQAVDKQ